MATQEPVDAYVFMHLLAPDATIQQVVQRFRESTPHNGRRYDKETNPFGVRWAQQMVGSFVIFGAVTAPSLKDLQRWIAEDFWKAGVRSEWSIKDQQSRFLAPYKHSPPYYAFVRVRTRGSNPRKVLEALDMKMLEKIQPLIAEHGGAPDQEGGWREFFDFRAATVSGKGFDILIEMAADSLEELKTTIFEYVGATEGVESTDTSFSYVEAGEEEGSGEKASPGS
jgi:hypothetical protein